MDKTILITEEQVKECHADPRNSNWSVILWVHPKGSAKGHPKWEADTYKSCIVSSYPEMIEECLKHKEDWGIPKEMIPVAVYKL